MRRAVLTVLAVMVLVGLSGCKKPWVAVGYDHTAPLTGAHTYSIAVVKLAVPQYEGTVRAAVQKELSHHGWQMVPSGGSETVFVLGDVQNAQGLASFYNSYGQGWKPAEWGPNGRGLGWKKSEYGEVDSVALGNPGNKLVIDIFDSANRQLLLRAVAQTEYWNTEKKNNKLLRKTIHRMLKKVPK